MNKSPWNKKKNHVKIFFDKISMWQETGFKFDQANATFRDLFAKAKNQLQESAHTEPDADG